MPEELLGAFLYSQGTEDVGSGSLVNTSESGDVLNNIQMNQNLIWIFMMAIDKCGRNNERLRDYYVTEHANFGGSVLFYLYDN